MQPGSRLFSAGDGWRSLWSRVLRAVSVQEVFTAQTKDQNQQKDGADGLKKGGGEAVRIEGGAVHGNKKRCQQKAVDTHNQELMQEEKPIFRHAVYPYSGRGADRIRPRENGYFL